MFIQLKSHPERPSEGLGLGLALVKSLVKMRDGTVEAHSDGIGKGCKFITGLPIPAEAKETAKSADQPSSAIPQCRILVVDDNRIPQTPSPPY